jgi:hypothetical protein
MCHAKIWGKGKYLNGKDQEGVDQMLQYDTF